MAKIKEENEEAEEIIEFAKNEATPAELRGKPGRRPTAQRRDAMRRDILLGLKDRVDRGWLLSEYLNVYYKDDVKVQDKKNILDSIARLSGYGAKQEESPESEKQAIADLMRDMKGGKDEG